MNDVSRRKKLPMSELLLIISICNWVSRLNPIDIDLLGCCAVVIIVGDLPGRFDNFVNLVFNYLLNEIFCKILTVSQ